MVGFKILISELGMIFGYIFGEFDKLFVALIIFMIIDYITGLVKAIIKKRLSSEVGYKGILKKISLFGVIAMANIIDMLLFNDVVLLRYGIMLLFLSNEGISILENLVEIGVPIPKSIVNVLVQVKHLSKTNISDKNDIEEAEKELNNEEEDK